MKSTGFGVLSLVLDERVAEPRVAVKHELFQKSLVIEIRRTIEAQPAERWQR